jgi:hypothetical protein
MVPAALTSLFWDVDTSTFDPTAYPQYTIERVLELGDEIAVTWLRALFDAEMIRDVLRRSRRLSPRSANFWALVLEVLEVPKDEVRALAATL